jgi:hypothetical protein
MHDDEPKETMMRNLVLACSHCTLEFAVSERRHADLSSTPSCPVCGSRELRLVEAPQDVAALPQEAA